MEEAGQGGGALASNRLDPFALSLSKCRLAALWLSPPKPVGRRRRRRRGKRSSRALRQAQCERDESEAVEGGGEALRGLRRCRVEGHCLLEPPRPVRIEPVEMPPCSAPAELAEARWKK